MRKETNKYYFSVEGETEQWYLQWLEKTIQSDPDAKYSVKFDCKIEKNPCKYVKNLSIVNKTKIVHVFDYESQEPAHRQQFKTTLDNMKKAEGIKDITYTLGYSNFAFELWIILHKADCNGILSHRRQYLPQLNSAYNENFEDLHQYKHEDNFKRILGKLTLNDVKDAVRRSKSIMRNNKMYELNLSRYGGYCYYEDNPSLSIWESIEKILKDSKII